MNADERELERILNLKRRQNGRIGYWLILTAAALTGLIVGLLVLQSPAAKTLLSRTRPDATPAATRQAPLTQVPPVGENPSPTPQALSLPQAGGPESREAARPSEVSSGSSAATGSSAAAPAMPRRVSGQIASGPVPDSARSEVMPPRFPGLPRVELVRSPASAGEGRGEAYAARILDPAGRPLVGVGVLLIVRMADGTVENIVLGSAPEPGTYLGTASLGRSTPVDLRIRVVMSDKRIEIPFTP